MLHFYQSPGGCCCRWPREQGPRSKALAGFSHPNSDWEVEAAILDLSVEDSLNLPGEHVGKGKSVAKRQPPGSMEIWENFACSPTQMERTERENSKPHGKETSCISYTQETQDERRGTARESGSPDNPQTWGSPVLSAPEDHGGASPVSPHPPPTHGVGPCLLPLGCP